MMRAWVSGAVLAVVVAACASGEPRIYQLGADALFDEAMASYQAGEWDEAIRAFERLTLAFPAHPRIQEARYRLADSYFGKEEYVTASSEFARLADDYPSGEWADDARFKTCESYYALSPVIQRDQQYTQAAIDHCQSLIGFYPNSEYVPRAQQIVGEMTDKLAEKLFTVGEFYYTRNAFDSAVVYFEDVVDQFPFTDAAPRALLRIVTAYETIGYEEEAAATRQRLLRDYPDSPEAQQVRETSLADGS